MTIMDIKKFRNEFKYYNQLFTLYDDSNTEIDYESINNLRDALKNMVHNILIHLKNI